MSNNKQPNRHVWFFRLAGGGNQCTEYRTSEKEAAMRLLHDEYGETAVDAVRRELTFFEYAGLLRCNYEGYGRQVYQALQDFFFRCDPRGHKGFDDETLIRSQSDIQAGRVLSTEEYLEDLRKD